MKKPTPSKIKAAGIALLLEGHSSRKVEEQLRAQFPGARVPSYVTLCRWLRKMEDDSGASMELLNLASMVFDAIEDRLPTMTVKELLAVSSRLSDAALRHFAVTQTTA